MPTMLFVRVFGRFPLFFKLAADKMHSKTPLLFHLAGSLRHTVTVNNRRKTMTPITPHTPSMPPLLWFKRIEL